MWFDASNNINFGYIVLGQVANEAVVQSPLSNWFIFDATWIFYFLGYELSKYLLGHTV